MNGALVVTTICLLDVFVGSGLGGSSSVITRVFPLHFPTMILTAQAANHGGPIGDVGWTAIWTAGLVTLAVVRLVWTTRPPRRSHAAPASSSVQDPDLETAATPVAVSPEPSTVVLPTAVPGEVHTAAVGRSRVPASPLAAGFRADVRRYRRDRVLWVLLVLVPVTFIALAAAQTPTKLMPVSLAEARQFTTMISLRHIHAAEMASIASALLAGVAGLFVVTGSASGDRRLVLAGFRPRQVLAGHLGVIAAAAVLTTAVSLAVSAAFFSPRLWPEYVGADLLIALTYAMVGVLAGPLTGRLGGLYLLLLLSIVDVGYGQTVMFHPNPPGWGAFLPARGAGRLLLDGAFTPSFEQYGHLLLGLAWLGGLTVVALAVFKHQIGVQPINHLAPGAVDNLTHAAATDSSPSAEPEMVASGCAQPRQRRRVREVTR
jgi:hypothetical protein